MDQSGRKEEREREGEKKRRSMRGDFGLAQGVRDVDILYNYKQKKKKHEKRLSSYKVSCTPSSFLPVEKIEMIPVRWAPSQKYRRKHGSVGGLRPGNEYDTALVYSSSFYSFFLLFFSLFLPSTAVILWIEN